MAWLVRELFPWMRQKDFFHTFLSEPKISKVETVLIEWFPVRTAFSDSIII